MSKQFHSILVAAGLAKPRKYAGTGEGSSVRHEQAELSFHSLRHTATSLLKNAGVSDAVAAEFIGHDSEAINRHYTHIEGAALRRAVDTMPDILGTTVSNSTT
jgi:integrase